MTEYVVLEQQNEEGSWRILAQLPAATARQALRQVARQLNGDGSHTLVAVPERSWQPLTARAELQLVLRSG